MKYLHNSPVKFHGNLTSRHCMIDNHWVVSITDWGLNKFKAGQERIYTDTNKTNEGMFVIDYSPWIGQGSSGCGPLRGYEPFRYKVVLIQVYLVEMNSFTPFAWRTKNIHPKCFCCSRANHTWGERNFCAFSQLEFVSKWPVSSLRMDGYAVWLKFRTRSLRWSET